MGFGIAVCAILVLAYVANRSIPEPRGYYKGLPTTLVAVIGMVIGLICMAFTDVSTHNYIGVAGPLIGKHGLTIATRPPTSLGLIWALLAGPAGALLANVTAPLAEIVQEPLPRAWTWLSSRWQAWRRKRQARKQARLEARREREVAAREAQRTNPQWLHSQAQEGAHRIKTVADRNKTFWAELLAYVRVLTVDSTWAWRPVAEVKRLLAWIDGLEKDLQEVLQENEVAKDAPFKSNRPEMAARLQERIDHARRLVRLAIAMLNDTDDDMRDIERDLPTGRTYAEERRDALIADYRTLLDHIELTVGASTRRAREELIARSDESAAMLSTGELRTAQANREIEELLARFSDRARRPDGRIDLEELATAATAAQAATARSRTAN